MISSEIRTRIAPTPSGFLHIGNICSFIKTWLIARYLGGKILLRIDDLDAERMRPEYLEDIFITLDFLGLQPDEGPSGPEVFLKNFSQHCRIETYKEILNRLRSAGTLYPCDCSRKTILKESPNGIYPGTCRLMVRSFEANQVAWRYCIPPNSIQSVEDFLTGESRRVDLSLEMGDFVVRRKDGTPAYQVASIADDIFFNINLVVRGEDLLQSSAAQLSIAQSLGLDAFGKIRFHHHTLVTDEHQKKLSKSAGDISIRWMRKQGMSKQKVLEKVSTLILGLPFSGSNLRDLQEIATPVLFPKAC